MKSKCDTCRYNKITHGERFWECTHPIPCEERLISENGCAYAEENKIMAPAIYKHFKNELEPEKYIYATMGISKPMPIKEMQKIYKEDSNKLNGTLYCFHTEKKIKFMCLKINGKWYHEKEKFNEELVLYKSLYDDSGIYARSLEMFAGKVDKEKYPEIKQEFRFELVRY